MNERGLSADGVSFSYRGGEAVLSGVSVRIPRRGLIGILGPNGSGKTTLLRLLGGLLRPSDGRVVLDGIELHAISRATVARRIAMVPQETQLAFEYTVLEMAMMGRYPHLGAFEIEGPEDLEIARNALRATGTVNSSRGCSTHSPAARNSGSSSRPRWRRVPTSCFSTSRPRHWTWRTNWRFDRFARS